MQFSLFDDENISRIGFQKALKQFDLLAALNHLRVWQHTLDAPKNIEEKIQAVHTLQQQVFANEGHLPAALGTLLSEMETTGYLEPLEPEFRFLREGLLHALAEQFDAESFEYIVPGLHPSEVLLELKQYDRAVELAQRFLQTYGEQPALRQMQGYALFKLGQEAAGLTAFTFALFDDPLSCTARFLPPGPAVNKFVFLQHKFGRSETAWLRLPFALWQDGVTYISPKASAFESMLTERINAHRERALREPKINRLQFNWLLYVAEMERLRNNGAGESARLQELRQQMRQLSGDLFSAYVSVLRTYNNL